jgi:hypothetical protein
VRGHVRIDRREVGVVGQLDDEHAGTSWLEHSPGV